MSTPATPTNVFSSQGNGQVYISWDLMPGATSYTVQRSTDQVNYTTVASPTAPEYLDTQVVLGTAYYYRVSATKSVATTRATGSILFPGVASDPYSIGAGGDTFSVANVTFTAGTDFVAGPTVGAAVDNIVALVNSTTSLQETVIASTFDHVTITFTAFLAGVAGNSIELRSTLTDTAATAFSGGTDTVGTSPYCTPVSAVPAMSGEQSLGELRLRSKQKADRVNSNFLTQTEWNYNINQSLFELYDLLIDVYEDYYITPPYSFVTNGTSNRYPLPDGVLTFTNQDTGVTEVAPAFYKLWGVDLAANTSPNGWVSMRKFNPLDRNKYFYPNSQSTIYGVFNAQYRLLDKYIEFIPIPSGSQFIRLRYFPRMTMLLKDSDLTTSGVSGWLEYVVVDAAIKALSKEESDTSSLKADKAALKLRIEAGAKNRDAGLPDTIQDTRSGGNGGWNSGGFGGNYGAGW